MGRRTIAGGYGVGHSPQIAIRMTREDKQEIEDLLLEGESVSSFIRSAIAREIMRRRQKKPKAKD